MDIYWLCIMVKKNLSIILVILLTLLLIAMVMWVFDKRIESIQKGQSSQDITTSFQNASTVTHYLARIKFLT